MANVTINGLSSKVPARTDEMELQATGAGASGKATLGDIVDTCLSTIGSAKIAAITASLPSLTFVAAKLHLAKDDTDKGAWRKKNLGQSWRTETIYTGKQYVSAGYANDAAALAANPSIVANDIYYNTTSGAFKLYSTGTTIYRAGRTDYPTNPSITMESGRPIIWDNDGASPTMWAVGPSTIGVITSVAAINNYIVIGSSTGAWIYNLISGQWKNHNATGSVTYSPGNFRTLGTAGASISSGAIVNATVNSVAITVLDDAPLDEYGMPKPTIFAGTAGGWSQIGHDGAVYSFSFATNANVSSIQYVKETDRVVWRGANNAVAQNRGYYEHPRLTATLAAQTYNGHAGITNWASTSIPSYISNNPSSNIVRGKYATAIGSDTNGLNYFLSNPAGRVSTLNAGAVPFATITSTYNTGYMVGDIRRCFLSNSATADRSVKAGTLTVVGTPTETVNAGGINVYSGFSAANYYQEASHADWNALGTGDFSIRMSHVKWGTAATYRFMASCGNGTSAGSWMLRVFNSNVLQFAIHDGATFAFDLKTTATFTDTAEHTVEVKRSGTTVSILVDRVVVASGTSALTISNATGFLRIGEGQHASFPWTGGQCANVRISATAPTAEQSAFIAAMERKNHGGQACLLSNSSSVSDIGQPLPYSGLIPVKNGTNTDFFDGITCVGVVTTATGALVSGLMPDDPILFRSGTANTYRRGERNINAELLEFAKPDKKPVFKQIASDSTGKLSFPAGKKPTRVNSTAGTYVSLATSAPTFDGFVWSISGLSASTNYDCELVEA